MGSELNSPFPFFRTMIERFEIVEKSLSVHNADFFMTISDHLLYTAQYLGLEDKEILELIARIEGTLKRVISDVLTENYDGKYYQVFHRATMMLEAMDLIRNRVT